MLEKILKNLKEIEELQNLYFVLKADIKDADSFGPQF